MIRAEPVGARAEAVIDAVPLRRAEGGRRPRCRAALCSHYLGAGPKIAFVRVGTLDDPDWFPPDTPIFTMSKQPWVILPRSFPRCTSITIATNTGRRKAWSGVAVLLAHEQAG